MRAGLPKVAALLCMLASAHAAQAATVLSFNGVTGIFGNDFVQSPSFSDTFNITGFGTGSYVIAGTISTSYADGAEATQNIDFTTVTLNGVSFTIGTSGQYEFRFVENVPVGSTNTLVVAGRSGTSASYSGTLSVTAVASPPSVPEPEIWTMLVLGFGMIGTALRDDRRHKRLMLADGRLSS